MADENTPVEEPNTAVVEGQQEQTEEGVVVTDDSATTEVPASTDTTDNTDGDPADPDGTEGDPVADGSLDVVYDDKEFSIDIPEDLSKAFSDNGMDVNEVAKELYEGEFGLSEATLDKLAAVYPRAVVEQYIAGIKATNDQGIASRDAADNQIAEADEARWQECLTTVGGEENWNKLEVWAGEKFSDEQFERFNSVMQSGNQYAQELALKALMSEYRQVEGEDKLVLIEGDSSAGDNSDAPLTAQQFLDLRLSGEYKKDPEKYDALRRKGIQRGI